MIGFVLREKEGRSYSSQTINSLSRGIKISVPMIPVTSNILAKGLLMPPPYFTTTFLRSQQKYKYYQNKESLFGKK